MREHTKILDWTYQHLISTQVTTGIDYQKIIHTAYSIVFKVNATGKIFYLKQTPKDLFTEPKIITFLRKQGAQNIPDVIATNNELNCFLMTSCGDCSLRELFGGNINLTMLGEGGC